MNASDRWSQGPRIEMLPLIDVMFLLLVAFVYSVAAMVRSDAIPVRLPRIDSAEPQDFQSVLVVTVQSDGKVLAGSDEVDGEALVGRVNELRAKDPMLSVLVNADSDARHGAVAGVLDRLRGCGQERVFLAGLTGDEDGTR